jgi:hypothetical protein
VNSQCDEKVRQSWVWQAEAMNSSPKINPKLKTQLNDLRFRLITLNSRFREADTRLAANKVQTEIWNVLAGIAHLEAKLELGQEEGNSQE